MLDLHFRDETLLLTSEEVFIFDPERNAPTKIYVLGSPWNAYALCLDDALEIGKGWVQAAVKGA